MSSTKKPTFLKFRLLPKTLHDLEANPDHDPNVKDFLPMNKAAQKHLNLMIREERDRMKNDPLSGDSHSENFPLAPSVTHIPGEAAKYGVYFDDREYNYLQHIKPLGQAPGAVFIPSTQKDATSNAPELDYTQLMLIEQEKASKEASEDYRYQRSLILNNEAALEAFKALNDDAYVIDEDDDFFDDDLIFKMKGCDISGGDDDDEIYEEFYENDLSDDDNDIHSETEPERSIAAPSIAMTTLSKMESKFEQLMIDEYEDDDCLSASSSDDFDAADFSFDEWEQGDGDDSSFEDSDESVILENGDRFNDDIPILSNILDDFIKDQHNHLTAKDPSDRKKHCIKWLDEFRKELRPVAQSTIDRLQYCDDSDSEASVLSNDEDAHLTKATILKRDLPNINTFRDEEVPSNLPVVLLNHSNGKGKKLSSIKDDKYSMAKTRIIISKRGLPVVINVSNSGDDDNSFDEEDNEEDKVCKENQGKARQKNETKEEKKERKMMAKMVRKAALAKKK